MCYFLTEDLIIRTIHFWVIEHGNFRAKQCQFCMDEVLIDTLRIRFPNQYEYLEDYY